MTITDLLPLTGKTIAVTRPAKQAGELARLIVAAGGMVLRAPLLEIAAPENNESLLRAGEKLADYDLAVCISPNAVNFGLPVLLRQAPWPKDLLVVAPGSETAKALASFGVDRVVMPTNRHDSEAMLQLPELQAETIKGQQVLIMRGETGRPVLAETLSARGAIVDVAICYRRWPLPAVANQLQAAWREHRLDALILTSSESLRYLFKHCEAVEKDFLPTIPLFVSHERIHETAIRLGLRHTVVTSPGDAGIVRSLCAYNWP